MLKTLAFGIFGIFGIRHLAFGILLAAAPAARSVTWADLTADVQARLQQAGLTSADFNSRIAAIDRDARIRVSEGDFDHLVFYVLQSTHFTKLPPIEPALSARRLLATDGFRRGRQVPPDEAARIRAFVPAIASKDREPRLAYFRTLVGSARGDELRALVELHYVRAMSFLYQKEFASRSPDAAARLYQSRGLSTDTAVEAGYAVHTGLGVLKELDPTRRIRRVLIVGPGMDLAPRTGMLESGPPESYQPWAVIDALLSLGLSRLGDLEVVGADINPRVVDHLRASREKAPHLQLVTGIGESDSLTFAPGYLEYFKELGRAVGRVRGGPPTPPGHLSKAVTVSAKATAMLRAEPLNIVTERLTGDPFDLVIATNILPYFGGVELALALSNIASMVAPGGVFLHNDTRPEVQENAAAAGLTAEQSRQVIIADVKGAPPLADTIVLHRRR
jgi:hypothetical protein